MTVPSAIRGRVSSLISALLAVTLIATLPLVLLNVSSGRWESWPGMDRLAGPKRFREILGEVPAGVERLKGGHTGKAGGPIRLTFRYTPPIDALAFLKGWTETGGEDEPALKTIPFRYTRAFKRPAKNGPPWEYLLFDERTEEALFYRPDRRV